VTCQACQTECKRKGRDRKGNQRFQCRECGKTYLAHRTNALTGMYLPIQKATTILAMLLEGNSVASVSRILNVHPGTILRLLVLAGEKCERIMADKIRGVEVRDVELDELWSWVGKKQRHVKPEDDQNLGDCWVYTAIERHSKLILNITMGKRNQQTTDIFIEGVRQATSSSHYQVTSDGFACYRSAVTTTLHDRCDYAMLIKVYKAATEGEARYSPAEVASVEVVPVMGQPDPERICTSIVERQNLSVRMGTRRFTRLSNAFSKKWENHWVSGRVLVRVLQLLPRPQVAARDSGDGRWDQRSHMERAGIAGGGIKYAVRDLIYKCLTILIRTK
jgi:transposase-like protein/IS1 family transposase